MYPTIALNSRGPDVLHLKALLTAKGLHASSDDDRYYAATAAIVRTYQSTHLGPKGKFLIETETPGEVTANTWRALEGEFDQHQHSPAPLPTPVKTIPAASPRRQFLNQLAIWYKKNVREIPKGSNGDNGGVISAMQKFHGMGGAPWCAMAINYAHYLVFGKTPPWGKNARVSSIWNDARSRKLTLASGTKICPGDIGVYVSAPLRSDGSAPNVNGHIFTITGVNSKSVFGLDGNSDDRVRASERNRTYLSGVIRLWEFEPITFSVDGYETGPASDR